MDQQAFRFTILCQCNNDYAEGFGPTPEVAEANAFRFYRKDHGKKKPADTWLEQAVPNPNSVGSHYEMVTA